MIRRCWRLRGIHSKHNSRPGDAISEQVAVAFAQRGSGQEVRARCPPVKPRSSRNHCATGVRRSACWRHPVELQPTPTNSKPRLCAPSVPPSALPRVRVLSECPALCARSSYLMRSQFMFPSAFLEYMPKLLQVWPDWAPKCVLHAGPFSRTTCSEIQDATERARGKAWGAPPTSR